MKTNPPMADTQRSRRLAKDAEAARLESSRRGEDACEMRMRLGLSDPDHAIRERRRLRRRKGLIQ